MRLLLLSALLFSLFLSVDGYKFLAYMPMFGKSHINFLSKITHVLIDAGHEVVGLSPLTQVSMGRPVKFLPKGVRIIEIPQCEISRHAEAEWFREGGAVTNFWKARGFFDLDLMSTFTLMQNSWVAQCEATLDTPVLIEQLKAEQFDAAYTETIDMCSLGLFHVLEIEKIALTQSLSLTMYGFGFLFTGAPDAPSYVPGMMVDYGEKMSFAERFWNAFQQFSTLVFQKEFIAPYQALFEKRFRNFPAYMTILSNVSLVFLNSEPLIDFPRPTSHKIVEIGGISVSGGHQALDKDWDELFTLRPQTVLLSFGTVALAHLMPEQYKQTIRETFRQFPNVTFVWKYEKPEHDIGGGIDNIVAVTWVPQNDFLCWVLDDHRLALFITHGGQGSTTEATTAGVPLIVIPVTADQQRNAQLVKRLGSGVVLQKTDLGEGEKLEKALREVLGNPSYAQRARHAAEMIANRPFPVRDIFVRNMELLAGFGPLRMLNHEGANQSFIQYYLIDIFAAIAFTIIATLIVTFFILRTLLRVAFRWSSGKSKKE